MEQLMSKEDLITIHNIDSQLNEPGDFSLSFDVEIPKVEEAHQYFEYYIQFEKAGTVLRSSVPHIQRVEAGEKQFGVWCNENFSTQTMPDQFQLFYRTFNSSKALKLEFDCPPELNRAGGSFAVSSPKKGMFGGGSWRVGSTEVPSVVLNLVEGQLYYSINLICAKPFETLIEVFGTNSSDECLNWPNLIEAPHATIEKESLNGAEDIAIQIKEYIAGGWVKSMPVLNLDFTSSEIETKNKVRKNIQKPKKVEEESDAAQMSDGFFLHSVMMVSVGKSMSKNKGIYDAARYQWKASKDRAKAVDYVVAHSSGKVVGVFKPLEWHDSNHQEFQEFDPPMEGRIGFVGEVAEPEILLEYLNKEIPKSYFPRGASNPVRFVEI